MTTPNPEDSTVPPTGSGVELPDDISEIAADDGPIACAELHLRLTTLGCPDVDDGSLADGLRDARTQIIAYAERYAAAETKRADALAERVKVTDAMVDGIQTTMAELGFVVPVRVISEALTAALKGDDDA